MTIIHDIHLGERELETLALVAEGLSNRAIAERLTIEEHSVKIKLTKIYDKLGLIGGPGYNQRAQAVRWYLELGH